MDELRSFRAVAPGNTHAETLSTLSTPALEEKPARLALMAVIGLTALLFARPAPTATAYEDFSMGGFATDQISQAYSAFQQAKVGCDRVSREIGAARLAYREALQSGRDMDATRAQLNQLLDSKDFFYIIADLIGGSGTPQADITKQICQIDGGINPALGRLFGDLVTDLRADMGARTPNDLVLFSPSGLVNALEANRPKALLYVRARNLFELLGSGTPSENLVSAKTYAQMLLELEFALSSPEIVSSEAHRVGVQRFDVLASALGEERVLSAAEKVLALPKDDNGRLAKPMAYVDPPPNGRRETVDPLTAFTGILRNEPRAYVIFSRGFQSPADWGHSVRRGADFYDNLAAEYGAETAASVAQEIYDAPKYRGKIRTAGGPGYELHPPQWWMENLLRDPGLKMATDEDLRYLAASDSDGIRAASGKFQVVYGLVNDVRWGDGSRELREGSMYGTLCVYFAGARDFGVRIPLHTLREHRDDFGPNGQDLVGKLFRVENHISPRVHQSPPTHTNYAMFANHPKAFSVITEDDWPDYLPIPKMTPPRTIEQLKADQTPVEPPPVQTARPTRTRLKPANCGDAAIDDPSIRFSMTKDLQVNNYFGQMIRFAKSVGRYQALSEICSGEAKPAIRDEFILAAVGDMPSERAMELRGYIEASYQVMCVGTPECPDTIMQQSEMKYRDAMAQLASGELQKQRDLLKHTNAATSPSSARASTTNESTTVPRHIPQTQPKRPRGASPYQNTVSSDHSTPVKAREAVIAGNRVCDSLSANDAKAVGAACYEAYAVSNRSAWRRQAAGSRGAKPSPEQVLGFNKACGCNL